jgi:hypothetical protein
MSRRVGDAGEHHARLNGEEAVRSQPFRVNAAQFITVYNYKSIMP